MVSPSGLSSSKLKVTRPLLMLCNSLDLLQAQSLRGRLSVLVEAVSPPAVSAALDFRALANYGAPAAEYHGNAEGS